MVAVTRVSHPIAFDTVYFHKVADELESATEKFGPFASAHEGLAVIEEEFLEFRSAVFWGVDQKGRPSDPYNEAVQLAAMALRFMVDVGRAR